MSDRKDGRPGSAAVRAAWFVKNKLRKKPALNIAKHPPMRKIIETDEETAVEIFNPKMPNAAYLAGFLLTLCKICKTRKILLDFLFGPPIFDPLSFPSPGHD